MRRCIARAPRRWQPLALLGAVTALGSALGCSGAPGARGADPTPRASPVIVAQQTSGTTALLQDVSAVNAHVVWVGGHAATWAVTTDGGRRWRSVVMPNADSVEFRDVYAADDRTAYLLSSGLGERSRIYKTTDGGATWRLQFTAREPKAFFDCFAFWDADHGIAVSDEVDGHFLVIGTDDGGATWSRVPADALPPAQAGEGAFAASGTCVMTAQPGDAWIGTGNAGRSRVLHTADRGHTWEVETTPLHAAVGEGITSLAVRDAQHLVALGGPTTHLDAHEDEVAITGDGGRSWTPGGRLPFSGPVYGAAYAPGGSGWLVAVGPRGAAASYDDGRHWALVDTLGYWSVGFGNARTAWAVGPDGRIARLTLPDR
ncbi:MAG TPA: hypothetical protein VIC55_06075 [Gemmatimonadaceae bacterium]